MRTTLFFIPHQIGPLPLWGWGWVAGVILLVYGLILLYRWFQKQPLQSLCSDVVGWLMVLAIVVFIAPSMETRFPVPSDTTTVTTAEKTLETIPGFVAATDTSPAMRIVGLPIRGYGVFLMLGVVTAVSIVAVRSKLIGVSVDQVLALAIWSVIGGMVGARLFYVIQKWSELKGDSLVEKLFEAFKFTEGGLVVYGGLFGGLAVSMIWCFVKKVPMLAIADLATPAFLIGLAFGRLGCLMNGCCYGGICESGLPAITFPMGSPPYVDQLVSGKLVGIEWSPSYLKREGIRIEKVEPDSWAQANQLQPGDLIDQPTRFQISPPAIGLDPASPSQVELLWDRNGQLWSPQTPLPQRSLPSHPSQIYASINAILLCGFLFWLWPNTQRSGTVLGLGLIGYGISRILEEFIRVDESGQFGTSLSISQWISLVGILVGIVILVVPRKKAPRVAIPT
jgi:phosphatidylglycerol:prolipoprotein diacylglycerol transferase